eukprot:CAMPEP_0113442176 /NCGR_PEP_ID=MMETSP0014_2-20120614/1474_1 /TAXON_ID=2857 /ORGANISM="Nitzschia sp." /LENGTH=678 /DNA_ID=CAMNT_0000333065 /DNA_START=39 /DNA_END=2075 /DNA_ORIENTATION=+ /assembly_acc=CAM_ASM_000159
MDSVNDQQEQYRRALPQHEVSNNGNNNIPRRRNSRDIDDSSSDVNNDDSRGGGGGGGEHNNHTASDEDFSLISKKHYQSTTAMCLCTFTHSWLLVSVFPYSGFMVISLIPDTDTNNAGPYAGLLAAAFMIGRAVTSFFWGRMADTYGRRTVLHMSLTASSIFSIMFGLSTSFMVAFFWRFLLGASNGVAGISKAVVSETANGYDKLETSGMSLSMGMWAWGFLLSPAISGFVSDPIRQYGSFFETLKDTPIYAFLEKYPFILPNLISVFLSLLCILAVKVYVPETLPEIDRRNPKYIPSDFWFWIRKNVQVGTRRDRFASRIPDISSQHIIEPLIGNTNVRSENGMIEHGSYQQNIRQARMIHTESVTLLSTSSPFNPDNDDQQVDHNNNNNNQNGNGRSSSLESSQAQSQSQPTMESLWSKVDTRNHLMLYWAFSFVAIAIDEAFPLFCMSRTGGLGLTENGIGKLLSSTGLVFAVTQYHVYACIVDKYGLSNSIRLGATLSAPLAAFIPVSLWLNAGSGSGGGSWLWSSSTSSSSSSSSDLTWAAFIYLSLLLAACRIFGLVFFSSITIVTNRTVIPSHRGTMNGLSMLGGSFAKGLGPVFAGGLVGFSYSGVFKPQIGSWFVFLVIGLLATLTARWTTSVLRKMSDIPRQPSLDLSLCPVDSDTGLDDSQQRLLT